MVVQTGFASDLDVSAGRVQEFYKANWPRRIALSDAAFYDWQFVAPPSHEGRDKCVIALIDGEIVGAMGLTERPFHFSEQVARGAELTTWVVDEALKGRGSGARILLFIKEQYDVLIGMGITDDALPIYMRSGFRYSRAIPRFVKILDLDAVSDFCEHDRLADKLIKQWMPGSTFSGSCQEVAWSDERLDESLDATFTANHFTRTPEYLAWRYDAHPWFHYRTFRLANDSAPEKVCHVVVREERSSDIRILHVMDVLGCESLYAMAVEFIESFALEQGFSVTDFYCTYSRLNRFFIAKGWFSAVDDTCLVFPHLFHPVELRYPPTTSLIYWSRQWFEQLCDTSNLYLTKQDADLDRPTMEVIERLA